MTQPVRVMLTTGPLAMAALLLCACAPSVPNGQGAGKGMTDVAATSLANRMAGVPPPPPPAAPFAIAEQDGALEFAYAYPAQAAAVPALVAKFGGAMAVARADARKMAQQDRKAARAADFPFRAHSLATQWRVTADTPRFLALQSETYADTGGAHGMTGYGALLWDKARRRESSMAVLMTSQAAFAAAIGDRFCAALDKARAARRGAPVVRGDDEFSQCIDPMNEVLVPTSKDGKLIDGVTVVIGPYSAGPYAEGSYAIALPVDAAMRGAIRTEYQDGFTGG